jgi:hypothetical protein
MLCIWVEIYQGSCIYLAHAYIRVAYFRICYAVWSSGKEGQMLCEKISLSLARVVTTPIRVRIDYGYSLLCLQPATDLDNRLLLTICLPFLSFQTNIVTGLLFLWYYRSSLCFLKYKIYRYIRFKHMGRYMPSAYAIYMGGYIRALADILGGIDRAYIFCFKRLSIGG